MIAAVRPDEWNLALSIHVLGAMLLVGTLVLAAAAFFAAWRGGAVPLVRLGYRALLLAGIPSWLLMRGGAQWIGNEQGVIGHDPPIWVMIGFMVSDPALLLLVAATVVAGIGAHRATAGDADPARLARVAAMLVAVSLAGYLVALWAMATKPL